MTAAPRSRLALNQRTTPSWSALEAIEVSARAGLSSVGLWREPVADDGLDVVVAALGRTGVCVSSLCRGGFFTVADGPERDAVLDDNRAAIAEAAALGAACLVLVPGGLPPGDRDLAGARRRVGEAIAALEPDAAAADVKLAIEPMHPIFAADRGVVSTLAQALDLAEQFDPSTVGVVVDSFHLWWEPGVVDQIARAGSRIFSYQISDWITPLPPDALLSRGMVGDGHIDFRLLTEAVAAAGYEGAVEVEIFNAELWAAPPEDVFAEVQQRYDSLVAPWLDRSAR